MGTKESRGSNPHNNNQSQQQQQNNAQNNHQNNQYITPATDKIDTSKLNPRVKKWLLEAEGHYTSYSIPKEVAVQEKERKEANVYRDPELVKLESLKLLIPPSPVGKFSAEFYTKEQVLKFQKKMPVFDVWPVMFLLQDFQQQLNVSGNIISIEQSKISKKIEETKVFSVKVLHNLATLGSEIQFFEQNLSIVHSIEQAIKTTNEKLTLAVKRTFKFLDLIPDDERIDVPCSIEVSVPYLRKDQYTFINLYSNTSYYTSLSTGEREQLRHLEDYWLQDILPNWDEVMANPKNSKFWREDIPFRIRGHVWQRLISNDLKLTPDKYLDLQLKSREFHESLLKEQTLESSENTEQDISIQSKFFTFTREKKKDYIQMKDLIRRDLPRTFPEFSLFKNPQSEPYGQILKVLETAAYFQPEIGYVQGMSYVASTLLLFMNDYEAFLCFTNLMNTPFLKSICTVQLKDLTKHSHLFQIIFAHYAPPLYQHFNNLNITTEHFLLDWWLTLFTKSVPLPLACHLWDCFLIEGEIFIHYAAVGILKQFENQLLKASFEGCLKIISEHIPKNISETALFETIRDFQITPKIQAIMEEMSKEHMV